MIHSIQIHAVEIFGGLSLAFATVMFAWVNLSVSRELRLARQETSRFQLFAVRQHLVMLIAEGKMGEQDPAWRSAYERINFFLRMDQKLHMLDLLWRYVRSQVEAERNPRVKARLEHLRKTEKKAAADVPEFSKVLNESVRAMLLLVDQRTNWFHRVVLWSAVTLGNVIAFIRPEPERKTTAKVIRRSVSRPTSDSFMRWQLVEDGCLA